MKLKLFDTHAHLDFPRFKKDRTRVIERARESGVENIVNVGADLSSSRRAIELSQEFSGIYVTVGVHPHSADEVNEDVFDQLKELTKDDRVVAIGETGLDFYYDNSPRQIQKEVFQQHLWLARETRLPLVIHSREAEQETLEILRNEHVEDMGGILHCFSGGPEMARDVLNLGLYIAFGGIITFKNTTDLRKIVKEVPLEKILLETDAPYLTPHPYRGQRNEPAYVKFVAEKIAEIKGVSPVEVGQITTQNAKKAYRLQK